MVPRLPWTTQQSSATAETGSSAGPQGKALRLVPFQLLPDSCSWLHPPPCKEQLCGTSDFCWPQRWHRREGGPDPELNSNLANIIEQCRNNNMPKASIEMAIKGVDKEKSTTYVLYTARGPGRSALVIEILTDNTRRTQQEIRLLLSRNGAVITDGVRHLFDQKGVVTVKDREQRSVSLEQALELAVEAGAEDVQESEDEEEQEVLKFLCDVSVLHQVRKKLDAQGLQSLSAGLEFIPNTTVELSEEEMKQSSELLMVLGNCQDVIRIYDNIQ
ncbi:translational activator of cytochrome c oxidase 1 isoform X2 [Alligator sinensis]|uniref:Translational activator of cytochrome c oxidase 1 isoform X2 n=1 Tax=Alligator sinensis TaxID=38654 RepID=A0A3Q0GUU7_ALLSI|nr:translational activator of cytochrome c oxidase 1 isoform X2 [Alligator sinensis]